MMFRMKIPKGFFRATFDLHKDGWAQCTVSSTLATDQ